MVKENRKVRHRIASIEKWLNIDFINDEYALTGILARGTKSYNDTIAPQKSNDKKWSLFSDYGPVLQFFSKKLNQELCIEIIRKSPRIKPPFEFGFFDVRIHSSLATFNQSNGVVDAEDSTFIKFELPIIAYEIYEVVHCGKIETGSRLAAMKENILTKILSLVNRDRIVIAEEKTGFEDIYFDMKMDNAIILYSNETKLYVYSSTIGSADITHHWPMYGDYTYNIPAKVRESHGPIPKTKQPS